MLTALQAGAVLGDEELLDGVGALPDQLAQALHLTGALRAGDARLAGLPGGETENNDQQEHQHLREGKASLDFSFWTQVSFSRVVGL